MDDLLPSEVFQRNIWGCMIDEPIGLKTRYEIGVDKILWECDYPHCDSTWPDSQKLVEEFLGELPEEEITAITHTNAESLFRWKLGVGAV
jgi:predicted TIM-barrel fold metal-dependent hydrolase